MTDGERIAKLEQRADEADRVHDELHGDMKAIRKDVGQIKDQLARQTGYLRGAVSVLTLLGGAIGAGIMLVVRKFSG